MAVDYVKDRSGNSLTVKKFGTWNVPPIVPGDAEQHFEAIRNMSGRSDDVFLATYPKCGTQWIYQIVSRLIAGSASHRKNISLEFNSIEDLESLPSPRILCGHLLFRHLPTQFKEKRGKVIHMVRNPKDVVASLYLFLKNLHCYQYSGKWEDFFEQYLEGNLLYSNWFDFVLDWENTSRDNPDYPYLCVTYEDMKEDCNKELRRIADFLEVPTDDKLIKDIVERCEFKTLKADLTVFDKELLGMTIDGTHLSFRKGEVGDWRNYFTVSQSERFDALFQEKMAGSSYCIKFESSPNTTTPDL